ncbi:uncharacterized protein LOC142239533 [Haematobia irritans]|uniref:uncharacterized protein LOC142239533 n=1 Tax=Haematobia irritans TaxID=7368 RepID=UPI003F508ECD
MHDKAFGNFEYCNFTLTRKQEPQLSFYIKLFQLPVTNCLVHIECHYFTKARQQIVPLNATWDACAFMGNRKRFLAFQRVYDIIGQYTNANHSCPYQHDIIAKNMVIEAQKLPFSILPGEYVVKTSFFVNGSKKLDIDAGGTFSFQSQPKRG